MNFENFTTFGDLADHCQRVRAAQLEFIKRYGYASFAEIPHSKRDWLQQQWARALADNRFELEGVNK